MTIYEQVIKLLRDPARAYKRSQYATPPKRTRRPNVNQLTIEDATPKAD